MNKNVGKIGVSLRRNREEMTEERQIQRNDDDEWPANQTEQGI